MGLLGSDDRAPDMSEVRLWRIAWHHHANAAGLQAADPSRAANRPWAYQQAWASVNLPEVPVRLRSFDSIPRLRNAVPVLVFVLTFLSIGVAVVDNGTIFCYKCAFEAGYIPL
jgi:hypothetical protein